MSTDLRSTPDDTPVTLLLDGERPKLCTVGELREALGPASDQVLSTGDAARIWPAYSEATWRSWASDGRIPGAWQDAEGGPWRLPYLSCKSFVLDLQRRGRRRGKAGPKGPWAAREAAERSA